MVGRTRAFLEHQAVVLVVGGSEFPYPIWVGVPEGSLLFPTIFLVFIDDLFQQLSQLAQCQNFADDMFISFNGDLECPIGHDLQCGQISGH